MDKFIYNKIQLSIDSIEINKENPRFEKVNTEKEAFTKMLEVYEDKIYNLAKHISENGVNPTELPIVFKNEHGKYTALDGNRRLTALKILNNPELLDHKYERLKSKIVNLDRTNVPHIIDVVEFNNEEQANLWIKLKHTGENDGIGTVDWDALQQSRFDNDKYPLSIQLISFMEINNIISASNRKQLKDLKITNLERLLGDPDVRDILSIKHEKKELFFPTPNASIEKILNNLISDLLSEDFTVNIVRTKSDRLKYIEDFKSKYDIDDEEIYNLKNQDTVSVKDQGTTKREKSSQPNTEKKKPKRTANTQTVPQPKVNNLEYPNTQNRETLIPKDFTLSIRNNKINDIYNELKRIKVEEYPNIIGAAFRVFLELSLDYYIAERNLKTVRNDDTLNKKLDAVKIDIQNALGLDKSILKDINRAISSNNNIVSINVLHGYIHSTIAQASPDGLKTTWNNYEVFFKLLYEILNN